MSFNNNISNDAEQRAEALYKLFRERTFLGEIELEFGKQGRTIVRKAVRTTAFAVLISLTIIPLILSVSYYSLVILGSFLVFCLVIVFGVPNILFPTFHKDATPKKHKIIRAIIIGLPILAVISFIVMSLLSLISNPVSILLSILSFIASLIALRFFPRVKVDTDNHEKKINWIKDNLIKEKSIRFQIWYYSVLITPFSIRTVWLWTLIFGYYRAVKDTKAIINLSGEVDWIVVNNFSTKMLESLLVVVVSYIATNIISELLALREAYVQGQNEVGGLKQNINSLSQTLRKENTEIKYIFDKMKMAQSLELLNQKLKDNSYDARFIKLGDAFIKSLDESIKTYAEFFKGNPIFDIFTLSALSSYLNLEVKHFREENKLITKFDLFGDIVHCILEELLSNPPDNLDKFEFFTIVAIPPSKFICYDEVKRENTPNWSNYLRTNYKARNRLKQKRHFLSIRFDEEIITNNKNNRSIINELEAIKSSKIKEDLRAIYYVKDKSMWEEKEIPIHHQTTPEGSIKFTKQEPPEDFHPQKLSEILKEVFHSDDCCKIIEVKIIDEDNVKTVKPLVDVKGGFLLDYYAVKYDGEWLFCYRAKYEKALNTAHIEIFHAEMDAKTWKPVLDDLDSIFAPRPTQRALKNSTYQTEIGEVFDIVEYH